MTADENALKRLCPDWFGRLHNMGDVEFRDLQDYKKSVVAEAYAYTDDYAHRYLHKCNDWTTCREHGECVYGTNIEFCEECANFHSKMRVMASEEDERDDVQIVLTARVFAIHFARVHEFRRRNR